MALDIDLIPVRTRGRAAKPITAVQVRELEPADLALLAEEKGSTAPPLKRISERHHALARNLASGMPEQEAAVVCGYSISRISILKADPAFRELLVFYSEQVDVQYLDLHERLSGLAKDAADIISDRMAEDPDKVTFGQLMEITKMGADRTGHGPQTTAHNLNINVDLAGRLQAARERVKERRNGEIIDGTAKEVISR